MLTFGKSACFTICLDSNINNLSVTERGNFALLYNDLTALLAFFTFCKSGSGTRCVLGSKRVNLCMCAFRLTNISTHITAFVIYIVICMSKLRYIYLFDEHGITCRAVLTLCFSYFGTSSRNCRINNLGVTECGYFFLCYKYLDAC